MQRKHAYFLLHHYAINIQKYSSFPPSSIVCSWYFLSTLINTFYQTHEGWESLMVIFQGNGLGKVSKEQKLSIRKSVLHVTHTGGKQGENKGKYELINISAKADSIERCLADPIVHVEPCSSMQLPIMLSYKAIFH